MNKLIRTTEQTPTKSNRVGFRLDYIEASNWGTIRSAVQTGRLLGKNGLATGENGAGKSTLSDLFVALFAAPARRHYNQAAGSSKGERTDESYVRGAWTTTDRDEQLGTVKTHYLRHEGTYTVILASFSDSAIHQTVTAAQVLWLQKGELKRLYAIAPRPLSIQKHFLIRETLAEFRKGLRQQEIEVYMDFSPYIHRLAFLLGMRSLKAFDLFNQTIGIKDIGNLNDFIRYHMLEKRDSLEKLDQVQEQFDRLSLVHGEMKLAEQQLAILTPLVEQAIAYTRNAEKRAFYKRCLESLGYVVAQRHKLFLVEEFVRDRPLHEEAAQKVRELEQQETTIREQIARLHAQEAADPSALQIQRCKEKLQELHPLLEGKKRQATIYTQQAHQLGFPGYQDHATFEATKREAELRLHELQMQMQRLTDELTQQSFQAQQQQTTVRELDDEIASLQQRQNQLPSQDIALREALCADLHIPKDEIAFFGELLRLTPTEHEWEPPVERCLHTLGRSMIVPLHHYAAVSAYMERTHLGGRCAYHAMRTPPHPGLTPRSSESYLYQKLEIKPDTAFTSWLEATLPLLCDYVCCQSLEQFQRESRAITKQGHIKHNDVAHEKDETIPLGRQKDYIFGWSNTDKIAALRGERQQADERLQAFVQQRDKLQQERKRVHDGLGTLHSFLTHAFDPIDWHAIHQRMTELDREIQDLRTQSLSLQINHATVEDLRKQEQALRTQIGTWTYRWEQIKERMRTREALSNRLQTSIETWPQIPDEPVVREIEQHMEQANMSLENIDLIEEKLNSWYREQCASLAKDQAITAEKLEQAMNAFKQLSPGIAQHLDISLEALEGYVQIHTHISNERLPQCRARFETMLKEQVAGSMGFFNAILQQQEISIREEIQALNALLKPVAYTSTSYIQFNLAPTTNLEVRQFKIALRACFPDMYPGHTEKRLEESFQAIQSLLGRLNEDSRWKSKVTDVRNWFDFWGAEHDSSTHAIKKIYEGSARISGGQKAKITLTTQVTALAHQNNITTEEPAHRSFRFILVDEAFAQSDDKNTRYALDLFRKFDLQFLVVTPQAKLHILEHHIDTCWLFRSNSDNNDTKISCLSIKEIQEVLHRQPAGGPHDHSTTDSPSSREVV